MKKTSVEWCYELNIAFDHVSKVKIGDKLKAEIKNAIGWTQNNFFFSFTKERKSTFSCLPKILLIL